MNLKSLRTFFAGLEILTGIVGIFQLGIGLLSLPFGIVYALPAVPALIFGSVGFLELKHLGRPDCLEKSDGLAFSVLAGLTVLTALAASYDFGRASAASLHAWLSLFFSLFMLLPAFLKAFLLLFAATHLWLLNAFPLKRWDRMPWVTALITLFVLSQVYFVLQTRSISRNLLDAQKFLAAPLPGKGLVGGEYSFIKSGTDPGNLSTLKGVRALRYYEFRSLKGAEMYAAVAQMQSAEEAKEQFIQYVENLLYLQDSELRREPVEGAEEGFIVSTHFAHDAFVLRGNTILNVRRKHQPDPAALEDFKVLLQALLASV